MTVAIEMGHTTAGAPAILDLEELLATRLLVQGNSGSGKSHLLRRLLEQSAPWVQQTIIDPEGDFVALADRFGHLADRCRGPHRARPGGRRPARAHPSRLHGAQSRGARRREPDAARERLPRRAVRGRRATTGTRCWWWWMRRSCSRRPSPARSSDEARKLSLGAMTNLMCRGRKRGLAGVIATQRLAKLAKNVAAEASNFLMGRTFLDIDMARAADLLGMERRQADAFRDLERGQFMALGPALSRRPLGLRIGPTETAPRNAIPRLMPLPEATLEDARAIVLAAPPPETIRPQRRRLSPDLLDQLMAAKSASAGDPTRNGGAAAQRRGPGGAARARGPYSARRHGRTRRGLPRHRRALSGVRGPLPHRGPGSRPCRTSVTSAAC